MNLLRKRLATRKRRGTLIIPFGLFALVAFLVILLVDFLKWGL